MLIFSTFYLVPSAKPEILIFEKDVKKSKVSPNAYVAHSRDIIDL
jgi:hypothetical protein